MKRLIALLTISLLVSSQIVWADEITVIDEFKGLQRNPSADKIDVGGHVKFENLYIKDGNIQSVKGRDRLTTSAAADTTVNMLCYYENAAGTTKKIIVRESDEIVTYGTDGTSRTSILGSLANEAGDCVQIGDKMYFNSSTDGLHVWTGSGSATAIAAVAAPSSVDFSASSDAGGLSSGLDCVALIKGDSEGQKTASGSCTSFPCTASICLEGTAATTTDYQYKITHYNNLLGIESEASSADTATLTGGNSIDARTGCSDIDNDGDCLSNGEWDSFDIVITGAETATTGTLASAPSDPWNTFRIYRTVAEGEEFFLVGEKSTGTFTDGKPDVALDKALDTTIDTITAPSFRYIEEYKGTLFTAEDDTIAFTRVAVQAGTNADQYWLESDKLRTGTVKPVTGMTKAGNSLLIFTSNEVIEITGFGADSFRQRPIIRGIGAVTDETIEVDNNGDAIFFAGVQGVYKLRVLSQLQDDLTGSTVDQPRTKLVRLSSPSMDEIFRGTDTLIDLDPADYSSAHAYYDTDNDLYFLYINDHSFVFDNQNATWSNIPATNMSASVFRASPSSAGSGVLTDNLGFLYDNWTGYENGIESGTVTGNPTSSTSTTLVDTGASFNTTGDGLKGLWVFLDNENGEYRQISSNNGTSITVSTAWTTDPVTADTYYIAYIKPEFLTKVYSLEKPPTVTQSAEFWLTYELSTASQSVDVYSFRNKESDATNAKTVALDTQAADFSLNGIIKLNLPMRNEWIQWGIRSFVYNTSNTIKAPVNVISYAFKGNTEKLT